MSAVEERLPAFKHARNFEGDKYWTCENLEPELREKANYYFNGPEGVKKALSALTKQIDILTQEMSCDPEIEADHIFWIMVAHLESASIKIE